jgi:hypothetical protein
VQDAQSGTDRMNAPNPGKSCAPTAASDPDEMLADERPDIAIPVHAITETNIHSLTVSPLPRIFLPIVKLIE